MSFFSARKFYIWRLFCPSIECWSRISFMYMEVSLRQSWQKDILRGFENLHWWLQHVFIYNYFWRLHEALFENLRISWNFDLQINLWRSDVVVITTAQFHSTKSELRFWAGSNPARSMSDIWDGVNLWQWSQLEIRLNAFRRTIIPQKQFIIIIIIECTEISTYWRSLSRTNKTILFILYHVYFYPDYFVSQSICVRCFEK